MQSKKRPNAIPIAFCMAAFTAAQAEPFRDVLKFARDELMKEEDARKTIVGKFEFGTAGLGCFSGIPFFGGGFDPDRSLYVHDVATLQGADFSLNAVLSQLASQIAPSVPGTSAASLFRRLYATQRARLAGDPAAEPHCSDGGGSLNGYPYPCRDSSGALSMGTDKAVAAHIATYRPMALVNRIDLAHSGWRNCGEYRIIYNILDSINDEDLIIFEGVLPNPRPGCKRACMPVADFWAGLSFKSDAGERAQALHAFFFEGLDGFRPVIHVDHYSARGVTAYGGSGSGQIRTNSFRENPWDLREFKTALDCSAGPCSFFFVPIPVRNTVGPKLWRQETAEAGGALGGIAQRFQASVIAQSLSLSKPFLKDQRFTVAKEATAGHHFASGDFIPDSAFTPYLEEYDPAGPGGGAFPFRDELRAAATTLNVTEENLVKRAQGQSCGGCHNPTSFSMQTGIDALRQDGTASAGWPGANFKHAAERPSPDEPAGEVYGLSVAMTNEFIPARQAFFLDLLDDENCLCSHGFVDMPFAVEARKIEAMVSKPFETKEGQIAKQIDVLLGQGTPTPKTLKQILVLRAGIHELDSQREQAVVKALAAKGMAVGPDNAALKPIPFLKRLPAWDGLQVKARGDSLTRRMVEASFQEPFRRTVTGDMPTH